MNSLAISAIPGYSRNEVSGQGYAVFGDKSIEFGPYDDPQSLAAFDKTLARWLANGRRLPGTDEQTFAAAPVGPIPFERFRDEILSIYKPPSNALGTYHGIKYALRCVSEAGAETTADLTPSLLAALIANRPQTNSPNRIRAILAHVSAICTYAEKMGYLRISPFRIRSVGSFVRAAPSRRKKHASREEIGRVLEHMRVKAQEDGWAGWRNKRTYAMTAVFAGTGIRASECYYLQTADLDFDELVIWITPRAHNRLKTPASAAPVPMPPFLVPILKDVWMPHRMSRPPGFKVDAEDCPWVWPTARALRRAPWISGARGSRPRDRMQALAAEVGVTCFGPLVLRHSLATHLLHWGAGSGTVKRLLRHTTERTAQEWYTHDDLPNLHAAVANVRF